jgi:hypothetical protein
MTNRVHVMASLGVLCILFTCVLCISRQELLAGQLLQLPASAAQSWYARHRPCMHAHRCTPGLLQPC